MTSSQAPAKHMLPFRGVDNDPAFYSALYESVREIRYVDLHPGRATDPVICSLGCAMLNSVTEERVSYEALSYCWGSIDDTTDITLHGLPKVHPGPHSCDQEVESFSGSFRITRNLKEALLALRYQSKARRLWVDAICINQMDPAEKTHQVGHMNKIYESAEHVIVWLGPADKHSIAVFEWCERMRCGVQDIRGERQTFDATPVKHEGIKNGDWKILAETFSGLLAEAEQHRRDCDPEYAMRNARELETSIVWALERFIGRPWFRRVWVYPEVFSAKRGVNGERLVTIHVGNTQLPWLNLIELVHMITEGDPTIMPKTNFHNLALFYNAWYWPTFGQATGCGLTEYFSRTSQLLASDPRDKIFALLHVAHDTRHSIHTDALLLPDYNKSLLEIILDYAQARIKLPLIMESDRNLDATNTFFFRIWIQCYDEHHCGEQLVLFFDPATGPIYPAQASIIAVIHDRGLYLELGGGVYIHTSVDGRYFLSVYSMNPGDAVIRCTGVEMALILSPLTAGASHDGRFQFRGACTPISRVVYDLLITRSALDSQPTHNEQQIHRTQLMISKNSNHWTNNRGHNSAYAGPGESTDHSWYYPAPQSHSSYPTDFHYTSHGAAPSVYNSGSSDGRYSGYGGVPKSENTSFASSSYLGHAWLNRRMSAQGHSPTCTGSDYPDLG